jgi:transposase-like protein
MFCIDFSLQFIKSKSRKVDLHTSIMYGWIVQLQNHLLSIDPHTQT